MVPYLVCHFSKPTLSNLVKECFGSDFPDVFNKPQVNVLFHYLKDIGAENVLLEREYQDKDYLEDFSQYYVKCFQNSGYKCARLHFFSCSLDHTKLDHILQEGNTASGFDCLKESYLGFIVIKPLPKTFIGRTCLKRYPSLSSENSTDIKLLARTYQVNLFGINLSVDSIAFQEQDKVVSACATTAIWSALHGCSWKNDKQIPACSKITTNAINHIDGSNNSFPNKRLTHKQILRALDFEGIKHHMEMIPKASGTELLEIVRCHIDSNIPLILGAEVYNSDGDHLGEHAITILGYKNEGESFSLYVHDDRFGPFAKANVLENNGTPLPVLHCKDSDDGSEINCLLTLQKKDGDGNWLSPHEYLRLTCLIIPTQQKVRISYVSPLNTCHLIVDEFENWLNGKPEARTEYKGTLTFTMRLYQIADIKKAILEIPVPTGNDRGRFMHDRAQLLTQSCARFQWVGKFSLKGTRAFWILFDATDIPQGNAITSIFVENQSMAAPVLGLFKIYSDSEVNDQHRSFIHLIYKYFRPPQQDYSHHLDITYGHLRAPKYLKPAEISNGDINYNQDVRVYYERCEKSLKDIYGESPDQKKLLWAIAADGALLIGPESENKGHPTLTGFKPARISGELNNYGTNWIINSQSGRYSRDYENSLQLLNNALFKFKSIFPESSNVLKIEDN